MATRVWLVRHGETQANLDRVFQGHLDTKLTERGYCQAKNVARALDDVDFDAVYSSDLTRASETARTVVGTRFPVVLDERLRELHYGVLQGVPIARFRDVLAQYGVADAWGPGVFSQDGMAAPEGESISDLSARLTDFLVDLDRNHSPDGGQSVMIVAHGGTLKALMTLLLELPIEQRSKFEFANCSVTRIVRAIGEPRLELHNAVYW